MNQALSYLRDLTEAGDLAGLGVDREEHGGGLRRLRLQQLQRLVECLKDEGRGKREAWRKRKAGEHSEEESSSALLMSQGQN